jgi:hypothetical protein
MPTVVCFYLNNYMIFPADVLNANPLHEIRTRRQNLRGACHSDLMS